MFSERPLNGLEAIFASCNVRFALLVVLDVHDNLDVAKLHAKTISAFQSSVLGHLSLVQNGPQGEWSLVVSDATVASAKIREILTAPPVDNGKLLHDLVHQETIPAEGPLLVQILKHPSSSDRGVGIFVNGNHAMLDGRSLTRLVGLAIGSEDSVPKAFKTIQLEDWKEQVGRSSNEKWDDQPPFLLPQHKVLTMKELCLEHTSNGGENCRFELPGMTLTNLKEFLHSYGRRHQTISGFLAAVILQSLAQEYHGEETRDIAISMLVDLRPYTHHRKDSGEISQLHGSVNLIESTDRLTFKASPRTTDAATELARHICELTTRMTLQLKCRVERGEAHRNALAHTSGTFDQAAPAATPELSNLGICLLAKGAKLFTSQRFDGYDGVSCMVHSESSTGCMRWNVSVGVGLDVGLIERVFTRARSVCVDLAQLSNI